MKKYLFTITTLLFLFPSVVFACGPSSERIAEWFSFIIIFAFVFGVLVCSMMFLFRKSAKISGLIAPFLLFVVLGGFIAIPVFIAKETKADKISSTNYANNKLKNQECMYVDDTSQLDKQLTKWKEKIDKENQDMGRSVYLGLGMGGYSFESKIEDLQQRGVKSGWFCSDKLFMDEDSGKWVKMLYKKEISLGC